MGFDVIRFLDDFGVPWWPPGENVSRNHVGVTCPFCDDTYNHLGIHVSGDRVPTCWKCGKHSLQSYVRTISSENFDTLSEKYGEILSYYQFTDNFEEKIRGGASSCIPPGSKNFKPAHKKYLTDRGSDADYLIHKYDLLVTSSTDDYPFRIIFPIKLNNKIVSYQGRSFIGAAPKYLTCRPEDEVIFHKDIFFNLDNSDKDICIIVEGVFDAVRLGNNAIASFGTSITPEQLLYVKSKYKYVFLLYDTEEEAQNKAKKAALTLNGFGIQVENIKLDHGDPGEMTDEDALYLKRELHLL
jgi:hypothetical protein